MCNVHIDCSHRMHIRIRDAFEYIATDYTLMKPSLVMISASCEVNQGLRRAERADVVSV